MNGIETNGENSSSSSPTGYFVSQPCKHLKNYKARKGFTSYTVLHAFYVVCTAKGSSKEKVQELECSTCHRLGSRIHACLHCVHFGCFLRHHIHKHAHDNHHYLSMDVLSGTIFCSECQDYTYDKDFSSISREQKELAGKMTGTMMYTPWEPSEEEVLEMKLNGCMKLRNDSQMGLRGLWNLGLTCFMNCIVQVMVHTPLLRDYYLSDEHLCCERKKYCEACLMYDIFQEFYSGLSTPFSIEPLLFAIWKNSESLAGYRQNDAQEFLSYVLPAMHSCCQNQAYNKKSNANSEKNYELVSEKDDNNQPTEKDYNNQPTEKDYNNQPTEKDDNNQPTEKDDCNCVIHQIFSGFYQSLILCPECKKSDTKSYAFWDVNLDFGENLKESEVFSLTDLIRRYTTSETVASMCDVCSSGEKIIKVTLKKLPIVMCFHLKRLQDAHVKISNKVYFPEYLDTTPYKTEIDVGDKISGGNILTLYGVVCHDGNSKSGHYFSYVRQHGDMWYKCDDNEIRKVDIKDVLDSEGYLLFYHKRTLEYEFTS